jgi:hypothetical protein
MTRRCGRARTLVAWIDACALSDLLPLLPGDRRLRVPDQVTANGRPTLDSARRQRILMEENDV